MKFSVKRNKTFLLIIVISFFVFMKNDTVQADFVPPEVETIIIDQYKKPTNKTFTMQPTPLSVVDVLNFVEQTSTRQVNQLLRYLYPMYNDRQLKSVTANLDQSNQFLVSQGYKTQITEGIISPEILKEELTNGRPVIAYLSANGDYWIEQETSIIIYGYQKVTFPNQNSQVLYMFKSVNHSDGAIYGGMENGIPLLLKESTIDPSANVTFKWDKTLYGFYK